MRWLFVALLIGSFLTPTMSVGAQTEQQYQTVNGIQTVSSMNAALLEAGYDGPWNDQSVITAYALTTGGDVTAVDFTADTPPPTAPAAPGLNACLARNLPMPDPMTYVSNSLGDDAFRQSIAKRVWANGLLLSAGMYGNQPMDVRDAFSTVVQQGLWQNSSTQISLGLVNLINALERSHEVTDSDLSTNCGLTLIRKMLREDRTMAGELIYDLNLGIGGPLSGYLLQRIQDAVRKYSADPSVASRYPYPEDQLAYLAIDMGMVHRST